MPTDRPRIQAYVEPKLYELFEQWKQSQGIDKDSAALNALLAQFFNEEVGPVALTPTLPKEEIEKMVRDEVNHLLRVQMEEKADFWVNRLSERVANVEQSLEKFVNLGHRQVDELKSDLGERLAACEDSLEILLSEPASDSLDSTRSPSSTARQEILEPSPEAISRRVIEACGNGNLQEQELPGESPSELNLNLTQLAQRLNISKSVMSTRKSRADFEEWSKAKDPEARAWRYDRKKQKFFPVEDRA